MAKSLLIVESPAKARTIGKYLGKDIEVKASVGHIRDLPVSKIGVDVENDFTPEYVTIDGKQKVISELKKAAKGKENIYLAPDPDREGEAIAWHIAESLKDLTDHFHRVLFHELTPSAIKEALAHPEELSRPRYDAQQARRILDRLVGYNLSPLLWQKVKRGLSAGRVQSVALRIIVQRERAIFAFKPEEYWSLTAALISEGHEFAAKLFHMSGKKIELKTGEETQAVIDAIRNEPFTVQTVTKRERKRYPVPAFTTSQLQQAAFSRLKFPASKTMKLAQQLYEGVDLGQEGSVGLITYMRTDSVRVADVAVNDARQVISDQFGSEYLPPKPVHYKNKKGAQDAHEAIRPSSAARTPESVKPFLSRELFALYDLIWRRFVACQMKPAILDQTTADIQAGRYTFRCTGSIIRFKGFLAVYDTSSQEDKEILPPLKEGQALELKELIPKQHFTQPPARFTEATLVKELEENGIGRPSTYAAIISTLKDKEYVDSQKGTLRPTELGFIVSDLLADNFPHIMDIAFTAGMENNLDEIEEGRIGWQEVLKGFYAPFENDLAKAKEHMLSLKREGIKTDLVCERCGSAMVLKYGKNGPFLSCAAYPDCSNAFDFKRDENGTIIPVRHETEETGEACDKCGRPMVIKKGKYGPFLACSGYPECKNTRPINGNGQANGQPEAMSWPEGLDKKCDKCGSELVVKKSRTGSMFIACSKYPKCKNTKPYPTGVKCPRCGGDLAERSSKRGVFYGCSAYPKCRYTLRTRPVNQPCPVCGSAFMVEAPAGDAGDPAAVRLKCPNPKCDSNTAANE